MSFTGRMMFYVHVITGTCFGSSDFDRLLFSQFVLGVFDVLVHITDLVQQSQKGHINPLRNITYPWIKNKILNCVNNNVKNLPIVKLMTVLVWFFSCPLEI